jgi:hypothetical protein
VPLPKEASAAVDVLLPKEAPPAAAMPLLEDTPTARFAGAEEKCHWGCTLASRRWGRDPTRYLLGSRHLAMPHHRRWRAPQKVEVEEAGWMEHSGGGGG